MEHIASKKIVFSWSPSVALDELKEKPRYFENKSLKAMDSFTHARSHEFPHFPTRVDQYPINQEEVFSLHQTFPDIYSIRVFTGGSEVELIKNLHQLNLLSEQNVGCQHEDVSIEKIVRMVLPKLQTPEKLEEYLREGVISYAQFAASADISIEAENKGMITKTIESVGLSFHRYQDTLNTPYRGATYISYPTGIGAAILAFYTAREWAKENAHIKGVIRAEQLPDFFGEGLTDTVLRELSNNNIDLVSHTHALNRT